MATSPRFTPPLDPASPHRPETQTHQVLPGEPKEDPIPPEMAPDQDMPELPHPDPQE
ncbi:MAG TPA: hypothetical protein VFP68_03725 [Burkholderiaceae bacterium]|nr:hypothetical protein [Burkholderiaceae bacterium]